MAENDLAFKTVYSCSALHLIPEMMFGHAVGIIPRGTSVKPSNISFEVKGFDPQMPIGLLISTEKRTYLSQTKKNVIEVIKSSLS